MDTNTLISIAIAVCFVISEILPFFPQVQSNGVLHFLFVILKAIGSTKQADPQKHVPLEELASTVVTAVVNDETPKTALL